MKPKYKVNDKVRIVGKPTNGKFHMWFPSMSKWLGKIMTIAETGEQGGYHMKEDGGFLGWDDEMIAGLATHNGMLLDKLTAEHQEFEDKITKIGKKIVSGTLSPDDVDRLSIQQRSFKTDSMILTARINSIKRAERVKSNSGIAVGVLPIEVLKEPEKKYNVIAVKGIPNRINDKFFFRLSGELHLSNADTNDNYDQQWTDDQIKDYGLEDYEKIEVAQS